jgi:2-hydroxy-3-oxopropionate reductase
MGILKIGFIGLGEMGKPMAVNLIKKGFAITSCSHVRKEAAKEIERLGGNIVGSPEEVAGASEVIIIMVRDTPQTDEVIYGKGSWEGRGVRQGIKTGSIIIICSTISPGYCQRLAGDFKKEGIDVLDAPVSGGNPMAEAGTLTFMVGGDRKAYEKCRPVFEAMGRSIHYLGGPGTGQAMKLINNYMMIVNAFGSSEAIAMGIRTGLDPGQMLEILKASSGNSSIVQNWDMLAKHQREYTKKETPAGSIFHKDMVLAVDFAREIGANADLGNLTLKLDESRLFPTGSLERNPVDNVPDK